jgi:glucose/arabinose dehydrogenase
MTGRLNRVVIILIVAFTGSSPFIIKAEATDITGSAGSVVKVEALAEFNEPWAMTFLPGGELLVTEKSGTLLLVSGDGASKIPVDGVPEVAYGGQGGLGDIILHPDYATNSIVYLSYAEADGTGKKGAAVAMAEFHHDPASPALKNLTVIWRQEPKTTGSGHYSHRLVFSPDKKLFITSGERQKQKPSQDWKQNLGKIIRLNPDGTVPPDNPYQDKGELARTYWSIGHRNILGIAFAEDGRLWSHEMGPKHGDEFNLIVAGENYGWPLVSWGNQYSGRDIPDHDTRPDLNAPEIYWVPTVAPSGLIIYEGDVFPQWRGNGIMGGLASKSLLRIRLEGDQAEEVERFSMGKRIREVEQGPGGAIWVLEDRSGGRLLKLTSP